MVQSLAQRATAIPRLARWDLQVLGIYTALVVMWIALTIMSPYFFTGELQPSRLSAPD